MATADTNRGTRVTFEGISKIYGSTSVLQGVDLEIAPGELVALLGPSGCGKTTMLRCLAGLEAVSGGRILLDGHDVAGTPANHRDMGVVFQAYSLFPHMTVRENVGFGLRMRRVTREERERRVAEALELVGLGDLGDRFAHTLSGGQQQRVALARALVVRPRVLLLDEPLSALDAKVRVRLRDEIRSIQTTLGITTIFVTHDQEEALAVADRVAVMQAGVIEQLGSPEELYQRPSTPFVARFIGESNRVVGTVVAAGEVEALGSRLPALPTAPTAVGDRVRVLIRPEHLLLARDGAAPAGGAGEGTAATVLSSGFLGAHRRTVVQVEPEVTVTVQHPAAEEFAPGERVRIRTHGAPVAVEAL